MTGRMGRRLQIHDTCDGNTPKSTGITENILGFDVMVEPAESCIENIQRYICQSEKNGVEWLACLNPHSYVVSLKDKKFAKALRDATWLIPDGVGIVLASRVLGGVVREGNRVRYFLSIKPAVK